MIKVMFIKTYLFHSNRLKTNGNVEKCYVKMLALVLNFEVSNILGHQDVHLMAV